MTVSDNDRADKKECRHYHKKNQENGIVYFVAVWKVWMSNRWKNVEPFIKMPLGTKHHAKFQTCWCDKKFLIKKMAAH